MSRLHSSEKANHKKATEAKDEEAARQIYLTLIQKKGHLANVWLEYLNFEQR